MKSLKLFFLISIIILIFSCASTDKKTETSTNKDQITDNSNLRSGEQSTENNEQLANRNEQRATNNEQDTTPVELTEDPYVEPSDITEFIAELAENLNKQKKQQKRRAIKLPKQLKKDDRCGQRLCRRNNVLYRENHG